MLTTTRVGDPEEDATMKKARPLLAKINTHGLVTIDSQMGKKMPGHWQRAYVTGFCTKQVADRLKTGLRLLDSVLVATFPHGEHCPPEYNKFGLTNMPRLEHTVIGNDNMQPVTRTPLGACQTFDGVWASMLPEVLAEVESFKPRLKAQCFKNSVQVCIGDMEWGRQLWLFRRIAECLQGADKRKKT